MSDRYDPDPHSMLSIEEEIRRLSRSLTEHTESYGAIATAAGEAEAELGTAKTALETAEADAYLTHRGHGTIPEIKALVTLAVTEQRNAVDRCARTARVAKRHEAHLQEAGRNIRTQLDALRTLAANIRHLQANPVGYGS